MKKEVLVAIMKRGAIFLLIVLAMDQAIGYTTYLLFRLPDTGKFAHITYVMEEAEEDCFVFGDSHARRHYAPAILSEELGLSVYNAGVRGQHLVFHLAMQEVMLSRHRPNLVIFNLGVNWLYLSDRNDQRLADLHPYYQDHRKELEPILEKADPQADFKLLLRSYQQNSLIAHIVKYILVPQQSIKGYLPLHGKMKSSDEIDLQVVERFRESLFEKDSISQSYVKSFQRFFENCKEKDINVVAVFSPTLHEPKEGKSTERMKAILSEINVPLFDYRGAPEFLGNYELFSDFNHMNHEGATLFTRMLSEDIKKELQLQNAMKTKTNSKSDVTILSSY